MEERRFGRLLAVTLALVLGVQFVLAGGVSAIGGGVGIYPVEVELADALRGAKYPRMLTIVNREEIDLTFTAVVEGEIANWLSVRAVDDPQSVLDELVVSKGIEARFMLLIAVPDTAENGRHTGTILFRGRPSDASTEESDMGVSVGIGATVAVDITGTQNLSGVVRDLSIDDAEVGQSKVRLRMQFENNGNIQTAPIISWSIRDAGGATVGEVAYSETFVQPGVVENIVSEWDASGQPEGQYTASVTVSLDETVIYRQDQTFELLPVGTLTRSGVLGSIILDGKPQPGSIAKIVGVFTNSGQIDTRAVFAAEVYRDGQLIQTVESREREVIVGELALLEAFFDVKEAGPYTIRGKVNYEGKVTEIKQIEFTVAAAAGNTSDVSQGAPATAPAEQPAPAAVQSSNGQPLWVWVVGGLALACVVAWLAFVLGRSRSMSPVRQPSAPEPRGHGR